MVDIFFETLEIFVLFTGYLGTGVLSGPGDVRMGVVVIGFERERGGKEERHVRRVDVHKSTPRLDCVESCCIFNAK